LFDSEPDRIERRAFGDPLGDAHVSEGDHFVQDDLRSAHVTTHLHAE
jgi:hypothetical protein